MNKACEIYGITIVNRKFEVASTHKQVLQFEWDQDKKEDAQATNYLGWLKANIKVPKNTEFYNTSLKPNLLNTELEGLKIRGRLNRVGQVPRGAVWAAQGGRQDEGRCPSAN